MRTIDPHSAGLLALGLLFCIAVAAFGAGWLVCAGRMTP